MSWFSLPWFRKADSRDSRKPRPRIRPAVEILEERIVLNNRFVVPAGTPIDNVTNFASLQAALSTSGLANGNVIQIEPGSSPGNIAGLTLPSLPLTIQGDPNVGLASLPQFTVSDNTSFVIGSAQAGFTFKGVNIGLVQGSSGGTITNGALTFNANGTITGSNIVDLDSAAGQPIAFDGNADVLTNSTLTRDVSGNDLLYVALSSASTHNLISGNTFIADQPGYLIDYVGSSANVSDAITGNSFLGNLASYPAIHVSAAIAGQGLTIQGNSFSLADGGGVGIEILALSSPFSTTVVNILGNTFNMTGSSTDGIFLNTSNGNITAVITGNEINTNGQGRGIEFEIGNFNDLLNATVQGNDLHDNATGVQFFGEVLPPASIDLGGGPHGSLGGNNFRGFTANNPTAISMSVGTVSAQHNIFSVPNPSTVVTPGGASLDTSNPETGTTAFVETLYIDYLHRAGSSAELQSWANSGLSQAQIANDILRSQESLTDQVDALYLKILGRPADSGGQSFFVNQLQHGGTLEQVMVDMFASPEYAADTGSDGAFIQSLYNKILGRVGDNPGVAFWLGQLPSLGRAAVVADFLNSAEFRGDAVEQLYGDPLAQAASVASLLPDLLHRTTPPSAAEVANWVNSGLDLLSLQAAFASTGEFFTNG